MPVVKVMPQLYVGAGGLAAETEKVFNDLVLLNGDVKDSGITITYTTSRFSYIYDKASQTGTGYMDVLLDEQNIMGTQETYPAFLSAEDEDGGSLQEIKVHASQHGKRFEFNPYGTGYIRRFFRNDEQR